MRLGVGGCSQLCLELVDSLCFLFKCLSQLKGLLSQIVHGDAGVMLLPVYQTFKEGLVLLLEYETFYASFINRNVIQSML